MEAAIDIAIPESDGSFRDSSTTAPVARLERVDTARKQAPKTLSQTLALIVGTEAMVVFKDVLQVDDAVARKVKRWAIRALADAARKTSAGE